MFDIDECKSEPQFDDLCRLCAKYDSVKISVFSDEGKRRELQKKIQSCLPFKILENDGLPKSLCFKCVYNLENSYEFRDRCIEVNRSLEKQLQKLVDVCVDDSASEIQSSSRIKTHGNENKKQYVWNANKRWLSVEHKPLHSDQKAEAEAKATAPKEPEPHDDNGLSRRKNNNPRKITRDADDEPPSAKASSSSPTISTPTTSTPATSTPTVASLTVASTPSPRSPPKDVAPDDSASSGASSAPTTHSTPSPVTEEAAKRLPDERKTYSCLLCEKNFTERSVLNHHFSTVHGIEPYEMVPQAPTSLAQPPSLDSLADARHEDEFAESLVEQETIVGCEVCRREFQDRASLWLHMVHAHREEASVSCGICLKICCDNITLIEHVNTAHSGDKAVVQRRYSCQVCGRQHDSRQKLLKHATLHTLIDNQGQTIQPEEMISLNNAFAPRECPICHRKFFNEEKLNQHTQNFHGDVPESSTQTTYASPAVVYRCELCTSTHANRMDRWWHVYHAHSGDPRVTCDHGACAKVFVTQSLRDEHRVAHHAAQGDFTNTCEVCGKLWESRTVFYKHMMNVHPKCLPTICGVCMKIFSDVPQLRAHVAGEHAVADGIRCDVCGRPYAERSKMLRHRRVHNVTDGVPAAAALARRKDDLTCSACPQLAFERLEQIAEHRRAVHQLFVCDLCPKFYNGNNHLWKHVSKQHKGDPNVTCELCLRTSASRAHLERHKIKYHSDPVDRLMARPAADVVGQAHKCELCAKEFRIRSLLKKHLKSCKGARPAAKVQPVNGVFPCAKCSKVFEQQSVLSKHVRNSHVVHFCEACDERGARVGFDSKTELLEHIRGAHAAHPELACDVDGCGKVLRLKADLQKHKQEHLRGYFTYICDMCGDMFSNRKKLRKHLLTFHKSHAQHLCAVCVAILPSVERLVEHVRAQHAPLLHRPFTCQICCKCYPSGCKVADHIGHAHGRQYRPCRLCWKIFADERQLEEHVRDHPPAEEKPAASSSQARKDSRARAARATLAQELSALGISFEAAANENGKRAADEEPFGWEEGGKRLRKKYKCTSCKETFRLIEELKEHKVETHGSSRVSVTEVYEEAEPTLMSSAEAKNERWTDYRPIECDCCGKTWNSKKQLWQHLIRSHPTQSMHTCGICLQVCKSYAALWYHLDALHPYVLNDPGGRFACYVCGHYHNSQSKLDKHIGVHKEPPLPREFRCQYCQRLYRSSEYFGEHVRRHEANATPKKRESGDFGGFSIDSILKSKASADELAEDDITEVDENEVQKMDDDDDEDEDMVELEGSESEAESASSAKEADAQNAFGGYANEYGAAQLARGAGGHRIGQILAQQLQRDDDRPSSPTVDADLESDISYSSVENSSAHEDDDDDDVDELVYNGAGKTVASPQSGRYGSMNNNQKQERGAVRDEKAQWRAEYFRRMADSEQY